MRVMNKTRIVRVAILLAIAYPLRIAYLAPTESNVINLLCMIIVIIGVIAFIVIGPPKEHVAH